MAFHHWLLPLSVMIALGTVANDEEYLLMIAYISLFSLYYIWGNTSFFHRQKSRNNGYLILGSLGTICLLLFLSFNDYWRALPYQKRHFAEIFFYLK